jgi:hypothetical protein
MALGNNGDEMVGMVPDVEDASNHDDKQDEAWNHDDDEEEEVGNDSTGDAEMSVKEEEDDELMDQDDGRLERFRIRGCKYIEQAFRSAYGHISLAWVDLRYGIDLIEAKVVRKKHGDPIKVLYLRDVNGAIEDDLSTAAFGTRLGEAISGLPKLQHLEIEKGGAIVGSVLHGLDELTSLRSLQLTRFFESETSLEFPDIVDGFLKGQRVRNLQSLILDRCCSSCIQAPVATLTHLEQLTVACKEFQGALQIHSLSEGLANGNLTLRELRLYNFEWDEAFGQSFTSALGNPSSTIVVLHLCPRSLNSETWEHALCVLQSNRSLQELSIKIETLGGASLVAIMESIGANPVSGLQKLELGIFSAFSTGALTAFEYVAAVHRLSNNSTLHELHVSFGGHAVVLDDDAYRRLVEAAKQNYGIYKYGNVRRTTWHGPMDRAELRSIGMLNQAGRGYLKADSADIFQGVKVLSNKIIRNGLHSIFIHVRENSQLCLCDQSCAG